MANSDDTDNVMPARAELANSILSSLADLDRLYSEMNAERAALEQKLKSLDPVLLKDKIMILLDSNSSFKVSYRAEAEMMKIIREWLNS